MALHGLGDTPGTFHLGSEANNVPWSRATQQFLEVTQTRTQPGSTSFKLCDHPTASLSLHIIFWNIGIPAGPPEATLRGCGERVPGKAVLQHWAGEGAHEVVAVSISL